jgi:hypothetical protein
MSGNRNFFLIIGFLLLFLFSWTYVPLSHAQQEVIKERPEETQKKEEPEKVVGTPQNIKERTGILVFVAWIWLSIIVLVYFLCLKIKETDRLYLLRFFSSEKK